MTSLQKGLAGARRGHKRPVPANESSSKGKKKKGEDLHQT